MIVTAMKNRLLKMLRLKEHGTNKIKRMGKKKKIVISSVIGIFVIGGIVLSTVPFTQEKKQKVMMEQLNRGNYDRAYELNNKYFKHSDDKEIQLIYQLNNTTISICEQTGTTTFSDAQAYINNLEKIKPEIVSKSLVKNNGYADVEVTYKNTYTKDINYVKSNIIMMDSQGNIIDTNTMVSSKLIKANGGQSIDTTFIKCSSKCKTYKIEVVDWR